MEIRISPERFVSEIQREFSSDYPFLKLEFAGFGVTKMLSPHQKLEKAYNSKASGLINITPDMRVIDLEKKFKDEFSLIAQVFRRSGNSWLQTTMTDNWTLKQQNTHGREISEIKHESKLPDTDFDLTRDQ
jgi:hypothetical protein